MRDTCSLLPLIVCRGGSDKKEGKMFLLKIWWKMGLVFSSLLAHISVVFEKNSGKGFTITSENTKGTCCTDGYLL